MKKNAKELYQKIVDAKVGDKINVRYKGINYNSTIEDALLQQGYKEGKDFERTFDWNTCEHFIKKLSNSITEYKEPIHDIKVGDIIYNSWGYEQTNIDFYQVIKTTKKTVSLRKISDKIERYSNELMSGAKVADKDNFISDEVIRKTPKYFMNQWNIDFEYGAGTVWDKTPMSFSCYA